MKLEEAIAKYEEKAEYNRKTAEECHECAEQKISKIIGIDVYHKRDEKNYAKRADEYEQLVGWLKELKEYRELKEELGIRI